MRQIPNNFRALPSPFSRIRCQRRRRRRRHFAPSGNTHTREPTIQPPATSLCHSPNAKLWKWPPSEWFRPMYCSLPRPRHFFRPRTDEWMLCGGPPFSSSVSQKHFWQIAALSKWVSCVCAILGGERSERKKDSRTIFWAKDSVVLLACRGKGLQTPGG